METKLQANQKSKHVGEILDPVSLRLLFNPGLVLAYGSFIKEGKANEKEEEHSDIDLVIVTSGSKNETDFGRSNILNRFCNLTSKQLDVMWLSKGRFADLIINNESFRRFFGELQVIYVGDENGARISERTC